MDFKGGAKPWEKERVSGLQLSMITRWNRSTCLASGVTGSFQLVLQAEKQSGRESSRGETSSHKSGGLDSVLALGTSTCPKNAKDLTGNRKCFFPFLSPTPLSKLYPVKLK
jgi:hypothetical protein